MDALGEVYLSIGCQFYLTPFGRSQSEVQILDVLKNYFEEIKWIEIGENMRLILLLLDQTTSR